MTLTEVVLGALLLVALLVPVASLVGAASSTAGRAGTLEAVAVRAAGLLDRVACASFPDLDRRAGAPRAEALPTGDPALTARFTVARVRPGLVAVTLAVTWTTSGARPASQVLTLRRLVADRAFALTGDAP